MMSVHESAMKDLRHYVHPQRLWYLEIIAVRPCLHGQGLGGQLMKAVIEHCGGEPIALECTDDANVGFYHKYGFEEIKHVRLEDKEANSSSDSGVNLSLMLRQTSRR